MIWLKICFLYTAWSRLQLHQFLCQGCINMNLSDYWWYFQCNCICGMHTTTNKLLILAKIHLYGVASFLSFVYEWNCLTTGIELECYVPSLIVNAQSICNLHVSIKLNYANFIESKHNS